MRRSAVVWICLLLAGGLGAADVASAEAHLKRIEALVEAGAAPRAALAAAQRQLEDARRTQLLDETLYNGSVTPEQAPQMLRAAEALRSRAAEALAAQLKLIHQGVAPAGTLSRFEQEAAHAERQWELAQSRARLVEEPAEMASREAELAQREQSELAERFAGKGTLREVDFLRIEAAFLDQFSKSLPVSARGSTPVHRSLGFDHRDRFDIALNPDQEEGRWLLRFLDRLGVPHIAFRHAVAGKATGAHIHVGLPSLRAP